MSQYTEKISNDYFILMMKTYVLLPFQRLNTRINTIVNIMLAILIAEQVYTIEEIISTELMLTSILSNLLVTIGAQPNSTI